MRLPSKPRKAVPQLLGMLTHGAGIELFLGWMDLDHPGDVPNHLEIFRGRRGGQAALVHELTLFGGPGMRVSFFQPPDARDAPAVLIDVYGGAYWVTTYLLAPDRQSAVALFESSDYEFADLDRDGVYELIAWHRRPLDKRCGFGIFAVRFYPEVFVRAPAGYRMVWPPPGWHQTGDVAKGEKFQIVAGFADLQGDGAGDLIVLQDRLLQEPAQGLAVYRLAHESFHLVTETPLPPQSIAFLLEGIRESPRGKELLVRTATPAKCKAGGDPDEPRTPDLAYLFQGGRLLPAQQRKR